MCDKGGGVVCTISSLLDSTWCVYSVAVVRFEGDIKSKDSFATEQSSGSSWCIFPTSSRMCVSAPPKSEPTQKLVLYSMHVGTNYGEITLETTMDLILRPVVVWQTRLLWPCGQPKVPRANFISSSLLLTFVTAVWVCHVFCRNFPLSDSGELFAARKRDGTRKKPRECIGKCKLGGRKQSLWVGLGPPTLLASLILRTQYRV